VVIALLFSPKASFTYDALIGHKISLSLFRGQFDWVLEKLHGNTHGGSGSRDGVWWNGYAPGRGGRAGRRSSPSTVASLRNRGAPPHPPPSFAFALHPSGVGMPLPRPPACSLEQNKRNALAGPPRPCLCAIAPQCAHICAPMLTRSPLVSLRPLSSQAEDWGGGSRTLRLTASRIS